MTVAVYAVDQRGGVGHVTPSAPTSHARSTRPWWGVGTAVGAEWLSLGGRNVTFAPADRLALRSLGGRSGGCGGVAVTPSPFRLVAPMIQRPNAVDGCFIRFEREQRGFRPHIGVVLHAKGPAPELRRVQEQIAGRIERMPTLACTVARQGHRTVWETAPAFDPYDHAHEIRISPGPNALEETVESLLYAPLDEESPRWGVWLIHGYSDGEYALFYRTHHAAQDGQALTDAVTALFGTDPPVSRARAAVAPAADRFWRQGIPARAIAWMLADGLKSLRPSLSWSTGRTLSGEAQVVSAAVPVSWLRETGRALGASPNDVCLAALAEAVRGWMPESWIAPEQRGREMYAGLPISLRKPEERFTVGNRLSAVRIPLSFWEESPTARVAAIARATGLVSTEGVRRVLRAQMSLPERIVYQIFRRIAAKGEYSLATSGLIQLRGRLAMGKDPIEKAVATAFLHEDLFEMVFLSYGGQVVVSVTLDRVLADVGNLAVLWANAVERLHHESVVRRDEPMRVTAPSL